MKVFLKKFGKAEKLVLYLHCTTQIVHQITNYDNDP